MTVNIPDANFKAYLVTNFDTNNNGNISREEAGVVTAISCANMDIASLEGIEAFVNLVSINAENNNLTGTIDISYMSKLETLYLSGDANNWNSLSSINFGDIAELKELTLNGNLLTSLDISKLTKLERLECAGRGNASEDRQPITTLDLASNTELKTLRFSNTNITTFDIAGLTKLEVLDFSFIPLAADLTLDVSHCSSLSRLEGSGIAMLKGVGAADLTTLTYVDLNNSGLTNELDLSGSAGLSTLSVYSPTLTKLWLKTNITIEGINVNVDATKIYSGTVIDYK